MAKVKPSDFNAAAARHLPSHDYRGGQKLSVALEYLDDHLDADKSAVEGVLRRRYLVYAGDTLDDSIWNLATQAVEVSERLNQEAGR